jgi:hypothetical protein
MFTLGSPNCSPSSSERGKRHEIEQENQGTEKSGKGVDDYPMG